MTKDRKLAKENTMQLVFKMWWCVLLCSLSEKSKIKQVYYVPTYVFNRMLGMFVIHKKFWNNTQKTVNNGNP